MGADPHYPALVQDDDLVRVQDGRNALRDNDDRRLGSLFAQRAAQLVIHMLNENAENSYTPLSLKPELVIRESVRKVN